MDIDWKLLVRVREQQRTRAQQRVVREREAAQAAQVRVNEARQAWQHEVNARSSLWSDLETAPGGLDMASLRQASAWSRTLDGRILQAAAVAQQAHQAAQLQQQQLDDSRRALRGWQQFFAKLFVQCLPQGERRRVAGAGRGRRRFRSC